MEQIIIWGCGDYGKRAVRLLKNDYIIIGFADNDPKKWGTDILVNDTIVHVLRKEQVVANDAMIFIATACANEVLFQLINEECVDIHRIRIFRPDLFIVNPDEILWSLRDEVLERRYLNTIKTASIGAILSGVNKGTLMLDSLTFLPGSSYVLDYALLKAIMILFNLKDYLEIGTWIGESLSVASDVSDNCYSVTLPPPRETKSDILIYGKPDYSNRLLTKSNMTQYLCDSKGFDFSTLTNSIDLYFIDGDHSYHGVYHDTKNVFNSKKEDAFVIWHDFKEAGNKLRLACIKGAEDALGEELFSNVFLIDNCLCGIFVPAKYKEEFEKYCDFDNNTLYSYKVTLNQIVHE